jgi:hypothetical protein
MGKKLLTWGVVGLLIFFLATRPESAAHVTRWLGGGLSRLANGFSDFFGHLT